jgi:hypothetical protein
VSEKLGCLLGTPQCIPRYQDHDLVTMRRVTRTISREVVW